MPSKPVFHRAHYNKIAALLGRDLKHRVAQLPPPVTAEDVAGVSIVDKFVAMFEEDNPNFNTDWFLETVVKHATE